MALSAGDQFSYVRPIMSYEYATAANIEYSEYLMWRPLYWFGSRGGVGVNERYSLADLAVVSRRAGDTTAAIQLKSYRWSEGKSVTARDVQFWFNLIKVANRNWWDYVAGQFPDNVRSFKVLAATRFAIVFKGNYSTSWHPADLERCSLQHGRDRARLLRQRRPPHQPVAQWWLSGSLRLRELPREGPAGAVDAAAGRADLRSEQEPAGRSPARPAREHVPGELDVRALVVGSPGVDAVSAMIWARDTDLRGERGAVAGPNRVSVACARNRARVDSHE